MRGRASMKQEGSERRRDRRVKVFGTAALGSGSCLTEFCGALVDVSAGGARLRFLHVPRVRVGTTVPIELAVADAKAPPGALPIRLRGRASLMRIDEREPGVVEAAIRFVEPLRVTEAFRTGVVVN